MSLQALVQKWNIFQIIFGLWVFSTNQWFFLRVLFSFIFLRDSFFHLNENRFCLLSSPPFLYWFISVEFHSIAIMIFFSFRFFPLVTPPLPEHSAISLFTWTAFLFFKLISFFVVLVVCFFYVLFSTSFLYFLTDSVFLFLLSFFLHPFLSFLSIFLHSAKNSYFF